MAKKKARPKKSESLPTFEESLQQLEETVRRLEEGQLGLGDSIELYESGIKHLKHCHELLGKAERRIELLSGVDAEGNPVTEPFDEQDLELEQKASARAARRSSAQSRVTKRDIDDVDDPTRLF